MKGEGALPKNHARRPQSANRQLTANSGRRLGSFFIDRDELPASDDLSAAVRDALSRSDYLIVICSPAAAKSHWVNEEILNFKRLRGEGFIRCLIASGEPFAARHGVEGAEECFPPSLKYRIGPDGQLSDDPAEPIAADIRAGGDGRRLGRLKIIAGLLETNLDALVQRQTHRQNRQLIGLFGASLMALAVVTFLMFSAQRAREEAGAARQIAQDRNASAEELLEFMLGDLRHKIEPGSQLDVLGSIGQEALDYYAGRPASEFDSDSLARRARALHLLGEIQISRGDLVAAQDAFTQSRQTTAELLARSPEDTAKIFDHAQSSFWVARMEWRRGNLLTAESRLREYLNLAQRLEQLEPDNVLGTQEVGYAHSSLGTILMEMGKWQNAKSEIEKAQVAFSSLVAAHPRDATFQVALGDVQSWLSSANLRIGHLDRALEHRLEQIRTYEEILNLHPDLQSAEFELVAAYMHLGHLTFLMGDMERALTELKEAEALGHRSFARDPDRAAAVELLAKTYLHQAETLLSINRNEEASRTLREAEVHSNKLRSLNGQDLKWQVEIQQRSQIIAARVLLGDGQSREGYDLINSCITTLSEIRKAYPDNQNVMLQLAEAMTVAAKFETMRGNDKEAEDLSRKIVDLLSPIGSDLQPTGKALLVLAYSYLGKSEEAAVIFKTLDESGFSYPSFAATRGASRTRGG
jgi:tetratricopeptide (TPR) repeat protein